MPIQPDVRNERILDPSLTSCEIEIPTLGRSRPTNGISELLIDEKRMVGAVRFELTTSCTRNKRASQATLRPDSEQEKLPVIHGFCNPEVWEFPARQRENWFFSQRWRWEEGFRAFPGEERCR